MDDPAKPTIARSQESGAKNQESGRRQAAHRGTPGVRPARSSPVMPLKQNSRKGTS